MAIAFRQIVSPPLDGLDAEAPDGAVIGIIGEDRSARQCPPRLSGRRSDTASIAGVSAQPR